MCTTSDVPKTMCEQNLSFGKTLIRPINSYCKIYILTSLKFNLSIFYSLFTFKKALQNLNLFVLGELYFRLKDQFDWRYTIF